MCGIAGIWTHNALNEGHVSSLRASVACIAARGPDAEGIEIYAKAAFGHRRLSIIDTSARANQPMKDPSGRYCLVFNGEIYNHRQLAAALTSKYEVKFRTSSDTEVLLWGLIHEGEAFLPGLNGFFAFAFYDSETHNLLCARDRYGIKPFYYSCSDEGLSFGSNLRAVLAFGAKPEISPRSLFTYLQLSYIPDPDTIITGIDKLPPGYLMTVSEGTGPGVEPWYSLVEERHSAIEGESKDHFKCLLRQSVERRLLADVPVGTFLSGGLDSSVITLLASQAKAGIPAFSIGFPDHPYFDESSHARAVAKHLKVKHEVFEVREKDLAQELSDVLNGMDEPFADSSAVLVSILSKHSRKEVKVALSGDGADELLGGYNKHKALLRSLNGGMVNRALKKGGHALDLLPSSRNHYVFDRLRKVKRYSRGLRLDFAERYLAWASFTPAAEVSQLLTKKYSEAGISRSVLEKIKGVIPNDFNSVLRTDMALVLAGDMLYKVDSMSMHRGLEVRVPFLDHEVVNFVLSLPASEKITSKGGKRLLRKAFENDFPTGTFDRGKRGFEAPLQHWLNTVLSDDLDKFLNKDHLEAQGIFDSKALQKLRHRVKGLNPGDAPHTLWAVLVFQHWWLQNMVKKIPVN